MRISTLVILLVTVAGLTVGLTLLLFGASEDPLPPGTQSVPYRFRIGDEVGVDTATDVFRLGQVQPGGKSWRSLTIAPTAVPGATGGGQYRVEVRGAGSAWLVVEPSLVTVPAEVTVTLFAPMDAALGEYRGTIHVIPVAPAGASSAQ